MNWFFHIAMFIAMLAVLAIMVLGIFSMTKGGEFNKKHGNRIMQARVFLQGVALGMMFLAYLSSQSG